MTVRPLPSIPPILGVVLVVAACVAPAAGGPETSRFARSSPEIQVPATEPPSASETPPATEEPSAPIDTSLTPVSRSNPGPEAEAVLDLCAAAGFDLAGISGMAKLPSARDLPKYVPLTGREPEIHLDRPAWVIAYSGRMTLPRALGWAEDPICVVIDGERTVFLTGRHGRGDVVVEPPPLPEPPLALPPLAP